MKIKCIQDHWPAKKGVLGFGAKGEEHIEGLTKDKVYTASLSINVTGSIVGVIGDVSTSQVFLIFNDDGDWETYQMNLFIPISE